MKKRVLRPRAAGFTLVELMIVVAIVAILATVALPSYRDYVRRGQLPEGFSALSDFQVKMEQYYQDNRSYGQGGCADNNRPAWGDFKPKNAKYFSYACALTNGGQGFVITATSSGMSDANVYTIDHAGTKKTTTYKGASVSADCWLSRGTSCE